MATQNWQLDPAHSEVQFKVKHLMISNVTGSFKKISGSIISASDTFSEATIQIEIDTASIDTGSEQRDTHLKSADFFNVDVHPKITFTAYNILASGTIKGVLSIHGIQKEITLEATFNGIGRDPWGNKKAGFSVETRLNRTDFGLNWNASLEAGGVLVGEEVRIVAEVQFVATA